MLTQRAARRGVPTNARPSEGRPADHAPSVESKGLIVEEAALILYQERHVAIDATRLFVGRMVLG
jgi:hypothetical protein